MRAPEILSAVGPAAERGSVRGVASAAPIGTVEAPVWGTFSVRDHLEPEAFLREVLVFDRLVIPYPDPHMPGEWERWRQPDSKNPSVSWEPERLDALLAILGTEAAPGHNGAQLAQRSMWNPMTWDMIKSNADIAEMASGNPYFATALGISKGIARPEELPDVVDAVAAYRSEHAWRAATKPESAPPAQPERIPTMEALIQIPRPLLLPPAGGNETDKLRAAVDLALHPGFRDARHAYFTWFRDFITPLRSGDPEQIHTSLAPASITEAQNRLRQLWAQEVAAAKQVDKEKWGSRVELGCMSAGALAGIGLAALAALPAVGVPVAFLSFAGWAARRFTAIPPPRSLGGASMFVDAQRHLDWLQPPH